MIRQVKTASQIMFENGRSGRRSMNQRALQVSEVVANVAYSGSGGAKVDSQGRKPLEREGPRSQAPTGRQNTRSGSKQRLTQHNHVSLADWWIVPIPCLRQPAAPAGNAVN